MNREDSNFRKKCPITFGKSDTDPIRVDLGDEGKRLGCDGAESVPIYDQMISAVLEVCATENKDLALSSMDQTARAMPLSMTKNERFNIALQAQAEMQPADAMESRLVNQMTALHTQGMELLRLAGYQDMKCHAEHYLKYAVKLFRLHNETLETFTRYRRGGEQRVTVQHVNVSNGGQAVVAGTIDKSRDGD